MDKDLLHILSIIEVAKQLMAAQATLIDLIDYKLFFPKVVAISMCKAFALSCIDSVKALDRAFCLTELPVTSTLPP